jgi:hypothetical protein
VSTGGAAAVNGDDDESVRVVDSSTKEEDTGASSESLSISSFMPIFILIQLYTLAMQLVNLGSGLPFEAVD